MTESDKRLRELAEKARSCSCARNSGDVVIIHGDRCSISEWQRVSANPATMLDLLGRLARAEARTYRYRDLVFATNDEAAKSLARGIDEEWRAADDKPTP